MGQEDNSSLERAIQEAEEEAEQFCADMQADYEDFAKDLKAGVIKGFVTDSPQRDTTYIFTGSRTDVKIEISGGQGKWTIRDKGNVILSLSLPHKVCEAIIAVLAKP